MKIKFDLPGIFAAVLMSTLFFAPTTQAHAAPRRVEVAAKRFEFTPGDITLKKGEPVVLVLKSADVAHGIRIKELGIDAKVGKGQTSEFPFTPGKVGTFVGHCSVFCGSGHGGMKLTVHVVE